MAVELEQDMEIWCPAQPGPFCHSQCRHQPLDRPINAHLYGRMEQGTSGGFFASKLPCCIGPSSWITESNQESQQTGATVITLGYANFIIIPACYVFGRRPVILLCSLIVLAGNVWQAAARSYNSFLGARLLSGVGAAANESIMAVVVADVFFLHERGKFVGFYL